MSEPDLRDERATARWLDWAEACANGEEDRYLREHGANCDSNYYCECGEWDCECNYFDEWEKLCVSDDLR